MSDLKKIEKDLRICIAGIIVGNKRTGKYSIGGKECSEKLPDSDYGFNLLPQQYGYYLGQYLKLPKIAIVKGEMRFKI